MWYIFFPLPHFFSPFLFFPFLFFFSPGFLFSSPFHYPLQARSATSMLKHFSSNRGGIAHKNEFTTTQGMHVFCLDLKTIRLLLPMFILFRAVEWLCLQFAHVDPPPPPPPPPVDACHNRSSHCHAWYTPIQYVPIALFCMGQEC